MKKIIYILTICFTCILSNAFSQVVIPTDADIDNTAELKVTSPTNNKGVLFTTLSTSQMNSIVTPATGLLIYNTTSNRFMFYNGSTWTNMVTFETDAAVAPSKNKIYEGEVVFYSTTNKLIFLDATKAWKRLNVTGSTL